MLRPIGEKVVDQSLDRAVEGKGTVVAKILSFGVFDGVTLDAEHKSYVALLLAGLREAWPSS